MRETGAGMDNPVSYSEQGNVPITDIRDLTSFHLLVRSNAIINAYANFDKGKNPLAAMRVTQALDEMNRNVQTALMRDWTKHGNDIVRWLGDPNLGIEDNDRRKTVYGYFIYLKPCISSEFLQFMSSKIRYFLAEANLVNLSEVRVKTMVDAYVDTQLDVADSTVNSTASKLPPSGRHTKYGKSS